MHKVSWSAGHAFNTPGKRTPDGRREWSFNNVVVKAAMNYLSHYENVAQLRLDDPTGKRDIPLKERSNRANAWGTTLHVDVHQNAQDSNWDNVGFGTETYAMKGTKHYAESLKLAKIVQANLIDANELKDRGVKSSNLHMLREIKAVAILTEGAFMDSRVDVANVLAKESELIEQGEAIAKGIVSYLNLKKKASNTTPVAPPKKEEKLLELNADQRKELAAIFTKAHKDGTFSSAQHASDVLNNKMTISKALYLVAIISSDIRGKK